MLAPLFPNEPVPGPLHDAGDVCGLSGCHHLLVRVHRVRPGLVLDSDMLAGQHTDLDVIMQAQIKTDIEAAR